MEHTTQSKAKPLADRKIVTRALFDCVTKLDPAHDDQESGHVRRGSGRRGHHDRTGVGRTRDTRALGFGLQITLWLWFTVLFANFAEAMAEGRGKAQADTLRKARAETGARRCCSDGSIESIASSKLRTGDVVVVAAGEFIPATAKSSKVSRAWTNPPSPANPLP